MMYQKVLKGYLFIVGAMMSVIGSLTAFNPINTKLSEGIDLAGNASALNDVRAFGMLLIASGMLFLTGAIKASVRTTASIWAILLFLSVGAGRLLGIMLDGMPSDGMVKATVLEFVIGALGLVFYAIYAKKQSH
jgi:hypothetical protein